MLDTRIGASPGDASPVAPPARLGPIMPGLATPGLLTPGLLNPATRFRKLLPYIGTALVLITAFSGLRHHERNGGEPELAGQYH